MRPEIIGLPFGGAAIIVNVELTRVKSSHVKLRQLDETVVDELAKSVDKKGLLQPITVREIGDAYEIVFGDHRVAAFRKLGVKTIPAFVKNMSDSDAAIAQIIENIHRNVFIDPVAEGNVYLSLVPSKYKDIDRLADAIGKTRRYVLDRMRIAQKLEPSIRRYIGKGLTMANVIALCNDKPADQLMKAHHLLDKVGIVKEILARESSESEPQTTTQSYRVYSNRDSKQQIADIVEVDVLKIKESRYQTRIQAFEEEDDIKNLARSIEQIGLLEFPKIRPLPEDPNLYEQITGHRRKLAMIYLKRPTMKCELYKNLSEMDTFDIVLNDNIQAKRFSNFEEGLAFLKAKDEFQMDHVKIAKTFSKDIDDVERKMESAAVLKEMSSLLDGPDILMFQQRCNMKQRELIESLPAKATEVRRQACKMVADGCTVDALEKYVKDYFIMHRSERRENGVSKYAEESSKSSTDPLNVVLEPKKQLELWSKKMRRIFRQAEKRAYCRQDAKMFHDLLESELSEC